MIPPDWLPAAVCEEGWAPDLRTALIETLRFTGRQAGTAVLFDTDHTEATYAAAEALQVRFGRGMIVTPRENDLALLTYTTPRTPDDADDPAARGRKSQGDARAPQEYAVRHRPSTTPLENCFLARKQFRINAPCERSVLAIFFIGSICERMT